MPELYFKGKEFVHNHHLSVPYRPLIVDRDKSLGDGGLDDNLIIHGDNLHALKALLPRYAGKVDCVFIDPPYNTGNEGWCYNDRVNNPVMKEWLSSNPVNKDDMLKHDKWCAMIWPRVSLLRELMADDATIWVTIDDNEVQHCRCIFDEIFGENNFIGSVAWQKKYAPSSDKADLSSMHDIVLCYTKRRQYTGQGKAIPTLSRADRSEEQNKLYKNPDNDHRGDWASDNYLCNKTAQQRPNLYYPIIHPITNEEIWPSKTSVWRYSKEKHKQNVKENRVWWGINGENTTPRYKRFLGEVEGVVQGSWWTHSEVGHNDGAKKEIKRIFAGTESPFDTPKPVDLLKRIIKLSTDEQAIILDSFAGSGTTAHATLEVNIEDNGERKFILVEGEDYADTITAERIRRVINGYEFQGTLKKELWREKITFTSLKKATSLLDKIQATKNIHEKEFDAIKPQVKDGHLIVTGEKRIQERVEGLEDSFTFCTLGDPIDMDDILTGKKLPDYQNLGAWLFHTATGEPLDGSSIDEGKWYLGESSQFHVWLVYRPDLGFLKSREAALTLDLANTISATGKDKKHLVFAPARFVPNKTLLPMGVEHLPLPYALYRVNNA